MIAYAKTSPNNVAEIIEVMVILTTNNTNEVSKASLVETLPAAIGLSRLTG